VNHDLQGLLLIQAPSPRFQDGVCQVSLVRLFRRHPAVVELRGGTDELLEADVAMPRLAVGIALSVQRVFHTEWIVSHDLTLLLACPVVAALRLVNTDFALWRPT